MDFDAIKACFLGTTGTITEVGNSFLDFCQCHFMGHIRAEGTGNGRRGPWCLADDSCASLTAGVVNLGDDDCIMLMDTVRKSFKARDLVIIPEAWQVFEAFA